MWVANNLLLAPSVVWFELIHFFDCHSLPIHLNVSSMFFHPFSMSHLSQQPVSSGIWLLLSMFTWQNTNSMEMIRFLTWIKVNKISFFCLNVNHFKPYLNLQPNTTVFIRKRPSLLLVTSKEEGDERRLLTWIIFTFF